MAGNSPIRVPASPNLPLAPTTYSEQHFDILNNVLRLYFNQLSSSVNEVAESGISGSGTVTSVGLSLPNIFTVAGSPVTTSGILAATLAPQGPNTIFAGPSSGGSATPTFRALTTTDVPTLNQNTTGNAGSVTNGVYTVGDQTIAGTKTFSSSIIGNVTGNVTGSAGSVVNIAGGTATQIPFQTSPGVTSFIVAPTTATTYLMWNGSSYTWAGGGSGGGGTVTSVGALTLGTSGTDLSSTVANSTTTPVITLNVPTASAANRGALSSSDWTTFNNKYSTGGALGTPSSGTLTNCTGYNYANLTGTVPTWNQNTTGTASNVTGVVAIANGGTGVTTALAVNVKLFGAVGNGVTDDRVAIQNAIDSISSGVVIFPAGSYLIGSNGAGAGLTLKPNVSLISFEGASVYLLAGANSIKLLNYVNPSSVSIVSNFVISGINLSNNGRTGCTAVSIDGNTTGARCSYIQMSEMRIDGTFSNAIYLKFCANTYMSNLFVSAADVGITLDNCADSDLVNIKVQSGSSYGYQIIGGAGAFDEGTRLSNCSSNGQGYGLYINGADWGICTGCSLTTAPLGALLTNGTNIHWKFTGCEFAVAGLSPANAGVNLSSGCSNFIFIGCLFSLNTFGLILKGSSHIVQGCHFEANINVDLYLDGNTRAIVNGNIFTSTGSTFSVLEVSSNFTNAIGNINNGTITLSGANSASANNITY
jgi:hypothetical protein